MNALQHEKVEQAFLAALAAREGAVGPSAPALDLTGLCGDDEHVRREVLSLISHLDEVGNDHSETKQFLNPVELHGSRGLSVEFGEDAVLREWGGQTIGQRVDGFTIIGKLGEG